MDGVNARWNAASRDEVQATGSVDVVAFVREAVAAIVREHQVDASRVHAVGFSNGAALCHGLAVEMPDVLAAVAGGGATTLYISPGTAHEWQTRRQSLHDLAPKLFMN